MTCEGFCMINVIDNLMSEYKICHVKSNYFDARHAFDHLIVVDSVYYMMDTASYDRFSGLFYLYLKLHYSKFCKYIYYKYGCGMGHYNKCDGYIRFNSMNTFEIDSVLNATGYRGEYDPHYNLIHNYDFASFIT